MTKNEVIVHEYVLKGAALPYISCMGLTKAATGHDTHETSIHSVYAEDVISAKDQQELATDVEYQEECCQSPANDAEMFGVVGLEGHSVETAQIMTCPATSSYSMPDFNKSKGMVAPEVNMEN